MGIIKFKDGSCCRVLDGPLSLERPTKNCVTSPHQVPAKTGEPTETASQKRMRGVINKYKKLCEGASG